MKLHAIDHVIHINLEVFTDTALLFMYRISTDVTLIASQVSDSYSFVYFL